MGNLVSIIIPTYNRATLVTRAVESVLAQTYSAIEIIVVDDGSTDNTEQVLRCFGEKIRYIKPAHAGLPAVTRNIGIHAAKGDYIAFLDDDDEWLPEKLERQIAFLEQNQNIGLVCSNAFISNETAPAQRLFHVGVDVKRKHDLAELLRENWIITSTVVASSSLIDRAGRFSESPVLRAIEDYDLWLRLGVLSGLTYLDEPLMIYNNSGNSIRSSQNLATYWRGMLRVLDNLAHFSPQTATRHRRIFQDMQVTYLNNLCSTYRAQKHYIEMVFWHVVLLWVLLTTSTGYKRTLNSLRSRIYRIG